MERPAAPAPEAGSTGRGRFAGAADICQFGEGSPENAEAALLQHRSGAKIDLLDYSLFRAKQEDAPCALNVLEFLVVLL